MAGHCFVCRKFWTRNRPGDEMRDRYNLNNLPAGVDQEILDIASKNSCLCV